MKIFLVVFIVTFFPFIIYGQVSPVAVPDPLKIDTVKDSTIKKKWEIKNRLILTGEQAYYENWALSGFNSVAFTAYYLGKYNYRTEKDRWESSLEMGYGILNQDLDGDGNFNDYKHVPKSDDRLNFTSSYSRKTWRSWFYNANIDFRSQFSETYKGDTALSANFFSPAYLLLSIGMNYERKNFKLLLSPISNRTTFVTDNRLEGTYGVPMGKKYVSDFGAYVKFTYNKDIFTNVNLNTKVELFYDYQKSLFHDTWLNWELFLNMKVNKYLSAFFNTQLVYDITSSKNFQFRERLGLMISWDF